MVVSTTIQDRRSRAVLVHGLAVGLFDLAAEIGARVRRSEGEIWQESRRASQGHGEPEGARRTPRRHRRYSRTNTTLPPAAWRRVISSLTPCPGQVAPGLQGPSAWKGGTNERRPAARRLRVARPVKTAGVSG